MNELEKVLEKKFFCPSKFAQEIEALVHGNEDMNYIDAIVHFCELNSIDVESVPCLLYTSPSPRDAHESRMPSSA